MGDPVLGELYRFDPVEGPFIAGNLLKKSPVILECFLILLCGPEHLGIPEQCLRIGMVAPDRIPVIQCRHLIIPDLPVTLPDRIGIFHPLLAAFLLFVGLAVFLDGLVVLPDLLRRVGNPAQIAPRTRHKQKSGHHCHSPLNHSHTNLPKIRVVNVSFICRFLKITDSFPC